MRAYKDIEGTELAKDGDRVALVISDDGLWYTGPDVAHRPTMQDGKFCFEGSYDQDGDTMTHATN